MPKLEDRNAKLGESLAATTGRVRDFTDLQVWQLARDLRKQIYDVFHGFPAEERYALTQQLRRAAISITANIAEGFGRYSYQENVQFCRLARGSAYEVRDHLFTAYDQRYLATEEHQRLEALAQRVIMTLNGYIRSTQARQKAEPRARS
jgi:four helix bundle protein